MISILILVGVIAVAILCLVLKVGYQDDWEVLFVGVIFIVGLILIGCIIAIVVGHCDTWFFQEHAELSMKACLVTQMSFPEKVRLQDEIIEHNKRIDGYYQKVNSPWSNWFYPKALVDLKPIPILALKAE